MIVAGDRPERLHIIAPGRTDHRRDACLEGKGEASASSVTYVDQSEPVSLRHLAGDQIINLRQKIGAIDSLTNTPVFNRAHAHDMRRCLHTRDTEAKKWESHSRTRHPTETSGNSFKPRLDDSPFRVRRMAVDRAGGSAFAPSAPDHPSVNSWVPEKMMMDQSEKCESGTATPCMRNLPMTMASRMPPSSVSENPEGSLSAAAAC